MVLIRWLSYFLDGFWDGITDNSVVFRHSWSGALSDRIRNGTVKKLQFESGVTKNILTEDNQKYFKSVEKIVFYKNKNSDYIKEQMIIPENVDIIKIYYYGSKPAFDFKMPSKDVSIRYIDKDMDYGTTDYVGNFDRYEDRRGEMF